MNKQELKKPGKPCFKNKECESNLCAKPPNNKINGNERNENSCMSS